MLPALSSDLASRILAHLGCERNSPSIRYLNQLIHAYVRSVPWESASRIIKRNIFTLSDQPVPLEAYKAAVARDYEATGYFLDRLVIVKIIDDRLWRFNSLEKPYKLEAFTKIDRYEESPAPDRLPNLLAKRFGIDESKVAAAFSYVGTSE